MTIDALPHLEKLGFLQDVAEAATTLYALARPLTVKLINLSENATYKIETADGQCWALRIHRDRYHSKAAIESELAWLMALHDADVVVTPRPVKGLNGEIIQIVGHAKLDRPRHVVLSEWETGMEMSIRQNLVKPFEVLGEATARMHHYSRKWKRPSHFTRPIWDFETTLGEANPHWGRWRDGIGVDAANQKHFGRTVDLIGRRLKAYGKNENQFGLIHCDLRLANLLMDGVNVKVIDFDDCGFGWFMYDAAAPVSFYEHDPQVPELIEAWKRGYRTTAVLDEADANEIPTFVMLRRLLLVAWIGSHSETDLAKSMGLAYTKGTVALCERYLANNG